MSLRRAEARSPGRQTGRWIGIALALVTVTIVLGYAQPAQAGTPHRVNAPMPRLTGQPRPTSGAVARSARHLAPASPSKHKPKKHHKKKHKKRKKQPSPPTASLNISTPSVSYSGGSITLAYSSSHATSCSLAASPAFWSGSNPVSVNCQGSYQASLGVALRSQQWTFTFSATGTNGQVVTATATLSQDAPPSFQQSSNWSGYVVPSSGLMTAASGTFTVPNLDCSQTPDSGVSTWVGIGGDGGSTGDLLQTGVRSDCSGGVQVDDPAWWEIVPGVPEIDFDAMAVSPGDVINASVYAWSDGVTYETCLEDVTTGVSGLMVTDGGWGITTGGCGGTFYLQGSTSGFFYGGGTTAEWIVEDYGMCDTSSCSLVPFADYGTLTFSNLQTSLPSLSLTSADAVELLGSDNSILSLPWLPSGSGFSISYTG